MSHEKIKSFFSEAVNYVASNISQYTVNPDKDLTRIKKLGPHKLLSFMVSCGSSSTKIELLDFFGLHADIPSASAFNQQRAKLKPEALEAVFRQFNSSVQADKKHRTTVFLPQMAQPLLFLVNPAFPLRNTLYQKGILQKAFIVCTSMLFTICKSIHIPMP